MTVPKQDECGRATLLLRKRAHEASRSRAARTGLVAAQTVLPVLEELQKRLCTFCAARTTAPHLVHFDPSRRQTPVTSSFIDPFPPLPSAH